MNDETKKAMPDLVGSVYLHVSNSGVTFTVTDGPYGPCIEVHSNSFGNMSQTLQIHTTPNGLTALKQLFDVAAERTYRKPYCHPARPIHEYERARDGNGNPVLAEGSSSWDEGVSGESGKEDPPT